MTDKYRELQIGDVVTDGGRIRLVGDINTVGGTCDCCRVVNPDSASTLVLGNVFDSPELLEKVVRD